MQLRMTKFRSSLTTFGQMDEISKRGVLSICSIKAVTPMIPACYELKRIQFPKLILDCAEREAAHTHQLSNIALFLRRAE